MVTAESLPYTFSYGSDNNLLFLIQWPNGTKTKRLIGGGLLVGFEAAHQRATDYVKRLRSDLQNC